jgi:predicted unusual protein kinase regulating ubiquinone biosynthesis (AarF/ABC1/UbiB family)
MSYHEGVSINNIDNNKTKIMISNDINFLILSSMIIHDFTHADLHNGNWKVELLENNKYNIIIYDCGLITSTNNIKFNKDIFITTITYDYFEFSKIIEDMYICSKYEHPSVKINKINNLNAYILNLTSNTTDNLESQNLNYILKYIIENELIQTNSIVNLILTMNMTNIVQSISDTQNNKIFKKNMVDMDSNLYIIFYTYIGILTRINKFHKLRIYFETYVQSDIIYEQKFKAWLLETLGHDDKDIYYDIITKNIYFAYF